MPVELFDQRCGQPLLPGNRFGVYTIRCEDQSCLGLFFSVFVPYCRCLSDRRKTFAEVKSKYPLCVNLPSSDNTLITFRPNQRPALVSISLLCHPISHLLHDAQAQNHCRTIQHGSTVRSRATVTGLSTLLGLPSLNRHMSHWLKF